MIDILLYIGIGLMIFGIIGSIISRATPEKHTEATDQAKADDAPVKPEVEHSGPKDGDFRVTELPDGRGRIDRYTTLPSWQPLREVSSKEAAQEIIDVVKASKTDPTAISRYLSK